MSCYQLVSCKTLPRRDITVVAVGVAVIVVDIVDAVVIIVGTRIRVEGKTGFI